MPLLQSDAQQIQGMLVDLVGLASSDQLGLAALHGVARGSRKLAEQCAEAVNRLAIVRLFFPALRSPPDRG